MKKILFLITMVLLLVFVQFQLVIAEGEEEHSCNDFLTGKLFGQHVSGHAQAKHFNGEMNPGMHQGYSICVP